MGCSFSRCSLGLPHAFFAFRLPFQLYIFRFSCVEERICRQEETRALRHNVTLTLPFQTLSCLRIFVRVKKRVRRADARLDLSTEQSQLERVSE